MKQVLERVLCKFPQQFSLAFAYGSGVFSQGNHPHKRDNMIDFILAVDDPQAWHKANIRMNRSHYSLVKYAGSQVVTNLQENYGAKVYFNTLVPIDDKIIKYGVIKTSHLIEDLLDWHTLYISGRMHKPISVIRNAKHMPLREAIAQNLQSAVHTSLLCLPESFTSEELFLKICGLSYSGDFRMIIGEDKRKIQNIVASQMDHFHELYESTLKAMPVVHWNQGTGLFEQDCSPLSILHHLNLLPRKIQHHLLLAWNRDGRYRDMEEVLQAMSYDSEYPTMVAKAVHDIVWWPSFTQSCKGILTAGITKAVKYSSKKLLKMFRSY